MRSVLIQLVDATERKGARERDKRTGRGFWQKGREGKCETVEEARAFWQTAGERERVKLRSRGSRNSSDPEPVTNVRHLRECSHLFRRD